MPKEKAPCKCLSIIMLDSVSKANKKLSSNIFRRMLTCTRKGKNWESYCWWFRKKWIDSDSNDETESDIDNDNMTNNLLKVF